jgi:hypothetical protein
LPAPLRHPPQPFGKIESPGSHVSGTASAILDQQAAPAVSIVAGGAVKASDPVAVPLPRHPGMDVPTAGRGTRHSPGADAEYGKRSQPAGEGERFSASVGEAHKGDQGAGNGLGCRLFAITPIQSAERITGLTLDSGEKPGQEVIQPVVPGVNNGR